MKHRYIPHTVTLLAFLFLIGCGLQDKALQADVTPTRIEVIPPSRTPPPTVQPTRTLTFTPIPTLSAQDALEAFTNLIEEDNECKLPCWLGVTPGQTKFEEVENIFSQFMSIAHTDFSSQWAFIRVFFPNFEAPIHDVATEINPAENGKVTRILVSAGAYQDINGPRDYSNPEFQQLWQRYLVPGIFTTHGPPEKIFLDTTRIVADTAGPYPFVLWIVYPQEGFLIRYQGVNSKIGDAIRICPMRSSLAIKIWDTEESSYEEFIKNDGALGGPFSLGPQDIEEVTDFDVQSFYEVFKNGDIDTCFETPASIWPY